MTRINEKQRKRIAETWVAASWKGDPAGAKPVRTNGTTKDGRYRFGPRTYLSLGLNEDGSFLRPLTESEIAEAYDREREEAVRTAMQYVPLDEECAEIAAGAIRKARTRFFPAMRELFASPDDDPIEFWFGDGSEGGGTPGDGTETEEKPWAVSVTESRGETVAAWGRTYAEAEEKAVRAYAIDGSESIPDKNYLGFGFAPDEETQRLFDEMSPETVEESSWTTIR